MSSKKERQLRLERTIALLQHKWGQDAIRQGRQAGNAPAKEEAASSIRESEVMLRDILHQMSPMEAVGDELDAALKELAADTAAKSGVDRKVT